MTLVLPTRFPPLLGWALLALAVDLAVSLMVAGGDSGAGAAMLFQLVGFLGWLGGLEALAWISQDSPWARARNPRTLDELRQALEEQLAPPARGGYLQRRMAMLKRWDLPGWRSYSVRLLSGASLLFLASSLFLFRIAPLLPGNLLFLGYWALFVFIRLIPLGCAATFLGPLSLIALPRHKPTPGELFHTALGAGAAALALLQIWLINQPPVGDFMLAVVHAGCNVWGWPYGIMMGGLFWYVGSSLRRSA